MKRSGLALLLILCCALHTQAAISIALLTNGSGQSNVDSTSYTTGSISPTANRLILGAVACSANDAATVAPTLSGNGLTWVQIGTDTGTVVGNERRITLFRAMGASPSSGIVTITLSATMLGCAWGFSEVTGMDTGGTNGSGAIVQSATNSRDANDANFISVTLAAFADATNNATFIAAVAAANQAMAPEAGFTELFDVTHIDRNMNASGAWRVGQDTTPTISWTNNTVAAAVAVEIQEPQATTRRIMLVQ